MVDVYRKRRLLASLLIFIAMIIVVVSSTYSQLEINKTSNKNTSKVQESSAIKALDTLSIKGRAPKTGYSREQFGTGWATIDGCDMRNIILNRDLTNVVIDEKCNVLSGILNDPYTGKVISFIRGNNTSEAIQIDHVVALSDAWQKGAQQLQKSKRVELANDPLELLAVDGLTNQKKGDGDAATWLPPNKAFRCQYVARQVAVKQKYSLWVTQAEYDAIKAVLNKCPSQSLPSP
jgi:hypothetical protein